MELSWALPVHEDPMLVLPIANHDVALDALLASPFLPRSRWKRQVLRLLAEARLTEPLMRSLYATGQKP